MSEPIIRVSGLTRRFGDFVAVDDLSLEVARGEIFGFLGANGSGKSTTIRMLIGLLQASAGEIRVDGVDVIAHPQRVRDRIGYMGQKVSLYQGITLRENVEFYAGLYGLSGSDLEQRWAAVRERFSLGQAEPELPESLPAGLRQRAGLALSMLHAPRLLFLDEPTAGVDLESRERFWQIIQEEAEAGVTVFATTHFLEEVEYCDHLVFIADGRVVADSTPEALRSRYSDGYQVTLDSPPPPGARQRLIEAGFQVGDDGHTLARDELDDAALAALASALGPLAVGGLHIDQPSMNAAFRRVISGAAAPTR